MLLDPAQSEGIWSLKMKIWPNYSKAKSHEDIMKNKSITEKKKHDMFTL